MVDWPKLEGKLSHVHIIIIALSISMTLGAWLYSKSQVTKQIEARFDQAASRVIGLIDDRMSRYEDALWSGVAKIDANETRLTHREWRKFSASLQLEERYPGVNGIGVIYFIDRADLSAFQKRRDAEGREFSIHPEHNFEFTLPITFIEPEALNAAAVGLDVAHETNRREALLASRDSGEAQITGPIVLVQDSGHTPGFLFYTPFYVGLRPATVEERREQFVGVVYAPFVVRNLVQGLLAQDLRSVDFSIRDGDKLIYDEHTKDDPSRDPEPMFAKTIELQMYGRSWSIDIRTNLKFRAENANEQPTMILIAGLVIEILIMTLIMLLIRSSRRAHEYASRLTADLREKSERLELANKEIEQFVYIASHDLKTPTRGIGFLTDMLEEDLDERFGPFAEDSDIKSHLNLIRERVERMHALTAGIMEFSRVNCVARHSNAEIDIKSVIENCVIDFQVRGDQVRLVSDLEVVSVDGNTFARVLENLIGNAFKYHPDKIEAIVTVTILQKGDRFSVSVKDNGEGIDPQFHKKIFEVFQTLRVLGDCNSTGIGLAIVKKAVELHGGTITIKSSLGEGAEFIFDWPSAYCSETSNIEKAA